MRYIFLLLSAFWLAACTQTQTDTSAAAAQTQTAKHYVEGTDYRVLEQPIAEAPAVIELFYYGCRACYYLTDELADWSKAQEIPVSLVPAHGEEHLADGARVFHTLAVLGRLDLHVDAYVLFQQPNELQGADRINALLDARGVERDAFWQAWSSDAVNQRMQGSMQLTALSGAGSTPSFIVQGKYVVEPRLIESSEQLFDLLQYLAGL